jgi:hypothetical protein
LTGIFTGAGVVHAASVLIVAVKSKILTEFNIGARKMWLLALEAFGAAMLFIFLIWWTMFSGRKPDNTPKTKADKDKHLPSEKP